MSSAAVTISHVSKRYGDFVAVDDLSLTIPAGTVFGLLGPNGAGKTSTLRMIMNITAPDSGEIAVLGETDYERVRHRVGYLPEERGLYRKMRVADHLLFLAEIKGLAPRAMRPKIGGWLERMGLADRARARVEELSKGMQQKVQFIATLLHEPDLVVLDEPFSGLDPMNTTVMREEIARLRAEGRTIIFCTHVMPQAERLCDEIALLDRSRLVLQGPLERLRREAEGNALVLTLRGASIELAGLPGFVSGQEMASGDGGESRVLVTLAPGTDRRAFLAAALERADVLAFEPKRAELEEIFLRAVGDSRGEAAAH